MLKDIIKSMSLMQRTVIVAVLFALAAAGSYGVRITGATTGPSGPAGTGSGAISTDSSNNIAVGTTTVLADTRLFILGANSATDKFAIQLKNAEGRPMFVLRNDGRLAVGPFPIGNPPAFTTSTLVVRGMIETVDSTSPDLTGGIKFPDGTTQTTAGGATASAANVSSGAFGANTGGGNYSFPASLGIGTAAPAVPLAINTNNGNGLQLTYSAIGTAATDGFTVAHSAGDIYLNQRENSAMHLLTNNTARLSILANGNVGVGTTAPEQSFHLVGKALIQNTGGPALFIVDRTDSKIAAFGAAGSSASLAFDESGIFKIESNSRANIAAGTFGSGATIRFQIGTDGLITVANRITGVSTPTADSDAATKAYVDSAVGVQYMGQTPTTYTGNLGGIAGANAKCSAAFSGSHMCTQGEALRSGATSYGASGWIACDLYITDDSATMCSGVTYSNSSASENQSCVQWASGTAGSSGPSMSSTGSVLNGACSQPRGIHCCK